MNILRRLFLVLFSVGLGLALLSTAWAHVGVATIGNRNTVKSWLVESGFYDNVVDAVLETVNKEQAEEGDTQIPIDDPQVQAVVSTAFSPTFLQDNVEKVLEGTYSWLEGDTTKPEFVIDLATAKQQLADGLSNYAVSRAVSLPACTFEQMAAMTDGFDVLNATCLPPGTSAQAAATELKNEILTSEEFLGDTTFSGEDFKIEEDGQDVSLDNSQFQRMQDAYKLATYGPYVFGILSVLLALAVLFLSASKRRGVKRVGIIFIIAGALLGLSFLAFNQSSSWLNNRAQVLSGETTAGRALAAGMVNAINKDISSLLLWYSLGFLVLGIGAVVFASLYRRKSKAIKEPAEPKPPIDDSPKIIDTPKDDKPAEAKKEPPVAPKSSKPPTKIKVQL